MLFHKGIVRVLLPGKFPAYEVFSQSPPSNIKLINANKQWVKAVNSITLLDALPSATSGFEIDVYYDTTKQYFDVHHDLDNSSNLNLETLLKRYASRHLSSSIWLDFKNLSPGNGTMALSELLHLRSHYQLDNKVVVESPFPGLLKPFASNGFYTSYYIPYFNPYLVSNDSLQHFIKEIRLNLENATVQSLSGYYYQSPFMHQYFPNYPLLIWGTNDKYSLVNQLYKKYIKNKKEIFVALYPSS